MKIAFWSPVQGQAGTTSNMLAIAMVLGTLYKKKALITQTHFNLNNLEAPLVGSNSKNSNSMKYFQGVGFDALIRNFKAAQLDQQTMENCCISIPGTKLHLLPGTSKLNRESFECEMETVIQNLLRTVDKFYDIVLIDVSAGSNKLSMKVIEECDLTVVNVNQNLGLIEQHFRTSVEDFPKNVFYLFGNYDPKSKYNIKNIRRRYKTIQYHNSGVIPYSTAYMDAQVDGNIGGFFKENLLLQTNKNDVTYFIRNTKDAAGKLLKYIGSEIEERTG